MRKVALAASFALASCATLENFKQVDSSGHYVSPEIGQESETIAKDMASFLAAQIPPAKTILSLEPSKTEFHGALVGELTRKGFGVAEGGPLAGSVEVDYSLSLVGSGVVGRMSYQGKEASRFYVWTGKELAPGGRYALREENNEK